MLAAADELARLEAIGKVYGSGEAAVAAVQDVSLQIAAGDFLAIMGPSGSGKSTLMHILGCLDVATSGRYWLGGQDVGRLEDVELARVRNRRIGFVFQQFHLLPRLSARMNVELPLLYRRQRGRRELAMHALEQVGLGNRSHHLPGELSGGQQQRVAIARALVTEPQLILADEPTGNLDSVSSTEVLTLLRALHEGGRTVALITHEADVARQAKRIVQMRDGRIVDERAA